MATTLALGLFATEANVANDELTAESTKTEVSQDSENMEDKMESKKNLFEKIGQFFANAFSDMKESAKLDKANFEAVKAESKANFEENRFHNSLARAKEQSKKSWEDAKMSPSERTKKCRQKEKPNLKKHKKEKPQQKNATKKQRKNRISKKNGQVKALSEACLNRTYLGVNTNPKNGRVKGLNEVALDRTYSSF